MTKETNLKLDRAYHQGKCEGAISMLPLGPWSKEPHLVEFKHDGFDCLLKRSSETLVWCGYVALSPEHPYFEKDYSDIEGIEVQLTYSDSCNTLICHKTENPDDKVWWLGFDCIHANDFSPSLELQTYLALVCLKNEKDPLYDELKRFHENTGNFDYYDRLSKKHYWTVEEAKQETMKLAEQLRAIK